MERENFIKQLRERIPNILFQMLLRASSAMGYANYPDNVVRECVREAAAAGMDVFRIFDALNWTPNMRVAMEATREAGAICEAVCIPLGIEPPIFRRRVKFFTSNRWFDTSRAQRELGYTAKIRLHEGLARTLSSYKQLGWI